MKTNERIEIVEVGPRDGLQNEAVMLSTPQKLALIGRALDAGVRRIEAASFVNPKKVPQMADAEAVASGLSRRDGVIYIGLVLNKRGALRAIAAGMDELGAVCAATDNFAMRNQGQTSDDSLAMCCEVVRLARTDLARANDYVGVLKVAGASASVRAFCELPVRLAVATLDRLDAGAAKLSREEVMAIFADVTRA